MSSFRCSAGHSVAFSFQGQQVSLPCPVCGVPVYKFRDVVPDEEGPGTVSAKQVAPTSVIARLSATPKKVGMVVVACVGVLLVAVLFARNSGPVSGQVSREPVLPMPAAAKPTVESSAPPTMHAAQAIASHKVVPTAESVSITEFKAVADNNGTVKVTFRLVNHANPEAEYPGLSIHWHGAAGADQVIRNDAYAHPPLPFTNADVTLELARPHDATGIDVKIVY